MNNSNSKRRLSGRGNYLTDSANKLKLDSISKILKMDNVKRRKKETMAKQVSRIALLDLIKQTATSPTSQEPPNFKSFLKHKENVQAFREFLMSQYSQENIDFYLACQKYQHLRSENAPNEMVKFMANQIYNDFLSEQAKYPINVSNQSSENIKANLRNPDANLFVQVQAQVFDLMRTDCYPRFCKTWQLDKKLAQEIITRTKSSPPSQNLTQDCSLSIVNQSSANIINTTSTTSQHTSSIILDFSQMSSSCRSRTHLDQSSRRHSLRSCCSNRINTSTGSTSRKRKLEDIPDDDEMLSSELNLKRIHQVPRDILPQHVTNTTTNTTTTSSLTPPPRPLAPKPNNNHRALDVKPNHCPTKRPFVGKAFYV